MKIIDLLNKIANGEEVPKKIKYKDIIFDYKKEKGDYESEEGQFFLDWVDLNEHGLHDEVEIIEEDKKLEKLKWNEKSSYNQEGDTKKVQKILLSRSEQLKSSINEIIDYLKEKE